MLLIPDPTLFVWSPESGQQSEEEGPALIVIWWLLRAIKPGTKDQGRHIYCLLWPHLLVAGPGWPGTARLFPTEMVKLELLLHWLACLFGLGGRLTGLVLTGSRILSRDPPREFAVGLGILLWGVERVIFLPRTYITHQGKILVDLLFCLIFRFHLNAKVRYFFDTFLTLTINSF